MVSLNNATSTGGLYSYSFFTPNQWQHVVLTIDQANVRYYKNGELIETDAADIPSWFSADTRLVIGSYSNLGDPYPLNGSVDEVMMFNGSLSATEIKSLYSSK